MRLDLLTSTTIREQLERMLKSFPGTKVLNLGHIAEEFLKATKRHRWTNEEFVAACDLWIEEGEFFPKVGQILKRRPPRPERVRQDESVDMSRCYRCHQLPFGAGYENAHLGVVARVRCGCPEAAPGWNTPAALELTKKLRAEETRQRGAA